MEILVPMPTIDSRKVALKTFQNGDVLRRTEANPGVFTERLDLK